MFLGLRIWVREQWERILERYCEAIYSFIFSFNPLTYLLSTYFMPDKTVVTLDSVFNWPYNIEKLQHQWDNVVRNHSCRLPVNRTPTIVLGCGWEVGTGGVLCPFGHQTSSSLSNMRPQIILQATLCLFLTFEGTDAPVAVCCSGSHGWSEAELDFSTHVSDSQPCSCSCANLVPPSGSTNCPGEWWHCLLRSEQKAESTSWGLTALIHARRCCC